MWLVQRIAHNKIDALFFFFRGEDNVICVADAAAGASRAQFAQ